MVSHLFPYWILWVIIVLLLVWLLQGRLKLKAERQETARVLRLLKNCEGNLAEQGKALQVEKEKSKQLARELSAAKASVTPPAEPAETTTGGTEPTP